MAVCSKKFDIKQTVIDLRFLYSVVYKEKTVRKYDDSNDSKCNSVNNFNLFFEHHIF